MREATLCYFLVSGDEEICGEESLFRFLEVLSF